MSKTESTTTDILECAICLGDLCQPRALPCLHSFCEKCLERHIFIQRGAHRQSKTAKFQCPKCRQPTPIPQNGVSGFRKDFRTVGMREILSSLRTNRNSFYCDVCSDTHKIVKATDYCLNCKKYLCIKCSVLHKEIPVLLDHHLVDVADPATGRNDSMCRDHENEPCRFFCETCNSAICILCIISNHKNHCTLDLDLTLNYKSSDMRSCIDRLSIDICRTQEKMLKLTQEHGLLTNVYEESKIVVRKKSRKLVSKIMADESKFITEIEHNYQQKTDVVCNEREQCHSFDKQLHTMKERLEHILRLENPSKINTAYISLVDDLEKLNEFAREIDKKILTSTRENTVEEIRNLTKSFISNIEHGKIKLSAEIIPTSSTKQQRTHKLAKDHFNTTTEPESNLSQGKFEDQKQGTDNSIVKTNIILNSPCMGENAAHSSITVCRGHLRIPDSPRTLYEENKRMCSDTAISDRSDFLRGRQLFQLGGPGMCLGQLKLPYSLCFRTDGMLVVAENGNNRLQVFDTHGNVDKIIKVGDSIPRSITSLAGNLLAFTDEQAKTIKIYSGESNPTITIDFKQAAFPYGITSLQDGSLVISDMIYENIQIVSPLGQLKLAFGSHGSSANNRFTNPSYLATRENTILVSDSGNHEIKVFSDSGKFIFKFGCYGKGNGQMQYPKGIAVNKDGYVFVADSGNDRILMFSPSGEAMGTVLSKEDGIRRPSGLAYSSNGRLAVALPDVHEVRVYEMTPTNVGRTA